MGRRQLVTTILTVSLVPESYRWRSASPPTPGLQPSFIGYVGINPTDLPTK